MIVLQDIFVYIVDNKPDLTPAKICGTIAQPFGCSLPANDGNWSVELPPATEQPSLQVSKIIKTNWNLWHDT